MHQTARWRLWNSMLDHPAAARILAEVHDRDVEAAARRSRLVGSSPRTRVHRWPASRPGGNGFRRAIGTLRVTLRARRRRAW